jgi:hypothetical protein
MSVAWRKEMHGAAIAEVARFVGDHPEYALDQPQPAHVAGQLTCGTNFVLWGHRREQPVVFKYYHENWGGARWRNENFCLRHFASTGCVPTLYDAVPDRLLVMACLPGRFLNQEMAAGEMDAQTLAGIGRELGKATGRLVNTPLPEITAGILP